MSRQTDFKLVVADSSTELEKLVRKEQAVGWHAIGNFQILNEPDLYHPRWWQAMVKYEEVPK